MSTYLKIEMTAQFPYPISKIHHFADGCLGQNKNSTILTMFGVGLIKEAPNQIEEIENVLP